MDKFYRFIWWNKQLNENRDFTDFMKYDSGPQSVHRGGVTTLKSFKEGYALANKKLYTKCTLPDICNYQALDGERQFFLPRAVLTENVHRVWKKKDFCMLVFFAFMYALLSCLHTGMLSSNIKRVNRQKIRK